MLNIRNMFLSTIAANGATDELVDEVESTSADSTIISADDTTISVDSTL